MYQKLFKEQVIISQDGTKKNKRVYLADKQVWKHESSSYYLRLRKTHAENKGR